MRITLQVVSLTRLALGRATLASSGAASGATTAGAVGRRDASGARPATASTSWASASRGRCDPPLEVGQRIAGWACRFLGDVLRLSAAIGSACSGRMCDKRSLKRIACGTWVAAGRPLSEWEPLALNSGDTILNSSAALAGGHAGRVTRGVRNRRCPQSGHGVSLPEPRFPVNDPPRIQHGVPNGVRGIPAGRILSSLPGLVSFPALAAQ